MIAPLSGEWCKLTCHHHETTGQGGPSGIHVSISCRYADVIDKWLPAFSLLVLVLVVKAALRSGKQNSLRAGHIQRQVGADGLM